MSPGSGGQRPPQRSHRPRAGSHRIASSAPASGPVSLDETGHPLFHTLRPPFAGERLHYFSFSLPLGCFATSLVATSLLAMTSQRDRRLLAAGANGGGIEAPSKPFPSYFCRGDVEGAMALNLKLYPLFRGVALESSPIPVKYTLERLGVLNTNEHRTPMAPASRDRKARETKYWPISTSYNRLRPDGRPSANPLLRRLRQPGCFRYGQFPRVFVISELWQVKTKFATSRAQASFGADRCGRTT